MQPISSSLRYKKRFLKWFMNNQLLEESDVYWFLEDLLNDDQALERISFVENIEASPKGIIISTLPDDNPFIFFKGHVQTDNIYTAYHEIQLNDNQAFYLKLKFKNSGNNRLYQMLLRQEKFNLQKNKVIANHVLNHLLEMGKKDLILQKIDLALDSKNQAMFEYYTNKLKEHLDDEV